MQKSVLKTIRRSIYSRIVLFGLEVQQTVHTNVSLLYGRRDPWLYLEITQYLQQGAYYFLVHKYLMLCAKQE